jgi:hypothetical protein
MKNRISILNIISTIIVVLLFSCTEYNYYYDLPRNKKNKKINLFKNLVENCNPSPDILNGYNLFERTLGRYKDYYKLLIFKKDGGYLVTKHAHSFDKAGEITVNGKKKSCTIISLYTGVSETNLIIETLRKELNNGDILKEDLRKWFEMSKEIYINPDARIRLLTKDDYNRWMKEHPKTEIIGKNSLD